MLVNTSSFSYTFANGKSMTKKALLIAILVLVYWSSCTMDDEDRCLSGYDWDPDGLTCRKIERDTDTGPAEVAQDAGGDSGATGNSDSDLPTGYLETCGVQEDCAVYEADYCLINPTEPEQSVCVTQNCTPGNCPEGSMCCDCSALTYPAMCLPDEALVDSPLATMCDCER